jgi:type I restriction enzyme S subunit
MAVSSAQPKLNKDNIRELKVVYPSLAEQEVIVSYLNEETQKIDSSISKEEERIKLLQEYRKSLISSVITGKIKVTEDA